MTRLDRKTTMQTIRGAKMIVDRNLESRDQTSLG